MFYLNQLIDLSEGDGKRGTTKTGLPNSNTKRGMRRWVPRVEVMDTPKPPKPLRWRRWGLWAFFTGTE